MLEVWKRIDTERERLAYMGLISKRLLCGQRRSTERPLLEDSLPLEHRRREKEERGQCTVPMDMEFTRNYKNIKLERKYREEMEEGEG